MEPLDSPSLIATIRAGIGPKVRASFQDIAVQVLKDPGFPEDPGGIISQSVAKTMPALATPEQRTIAELAVAAELQDRLGELSDDIHERLQELMDRKSKSMQTLSNVMKAISDTRDQVAQNIK